MAKYKVVLDRKACIGAFTCALTHPEEKIWEMDEVNGKVNLTLTGEELKKNPEQHEVIIEDKKIALKVADTGQVCPVFAIKVIDLETGKDLVR